MIEQIRQRVKAWKRLYTEGCDLVNENSPWREILAELEYYSADRFSCSFMPKRQKAIETIGDFSCDEQKFLETLPAYKNVQFYLSNDNYRNEFTDKIDGVEIFYMYFAETEDVPFREYTIVTDRQDLWGLEIYELYQARFLKFGQHAIIRYVKEPPADFFVPEDEDALPF